MREFRLDRTMSVDVVAPWRYIWGGSQRRIPILMYHSIESGASAEHQVRGIHTTPQAFAEQMRYLHERGYRTLRVGEVSSALRTSRAQAKLVAITFDDGYQSFYTEALPVLARYGFTATVYVVASYVGKCASEFTPRSYMCWDELRDIRRQRMSIGSHTVTHPQLQMLSDQQREWEIRASKEWIEDELSCPVHGFSYPYGFPEHDITFARRIGEQLRSAGYTHAVSTVIGRAWKKSSAYMLPRLPMNAHDDLPLCAAKLTGSYDWMHAAQWIRKRLKASQMLGTRSTPADA